MTLAHTALLVWFALVPAAGPPSGDRLTVYPSRYYIVHSDLDAASVREAIIRMTKVAQEYSRRTQAFSGRITQRLPFYLFRHVKDYVAAGGMPGSAGVFTGDRLMVVAGPTVTRATWRIAQHEGFHQFARAVIGGDIPAWVNEGMAVYFEEGLFTGDGFIAGLIPQQRLMRVRSRIENKWFKPIRRMMLLGHGAWNRELNLSNYDQAWSMVHFLAHADGGRYSAHFEGFIRDVGQKGLRWDHAWRRNFGAQPEEFEDAWRLFWRKLPDHPTRNLYAQATVATLTSFLARSVSQKQRFNDFAAFSEAAQAGKLQAHREDWLPESLLREAMQAARQTGDWSLTARGRRRPTLVCTLEDGTKLVGSFTLRGPRVGKVNVTVSKKR